MKTWQDTSRWDLSPCPVIDILSRHVHSWCVWCHYNLCKCNQYFYKNGLTAYRFKIFNSLDLEGIHMCQLKKCTCSIVFHGKLQVTQLTSCCKSMLQVVTCVYPPGVIWIFFFPSNVRKSFCFHDAYWIVQIFSIYGKRLWKWHRWNLLQIACNQTSTDGHEILEEQTLKTVAAPYSTCCSSYEAKLFGGWNIRWI